MGKRGVEFADIDSARYEYSTLKYWTMAAFNVDPPSVKMQSRDLPLADGTADFIGFGDNIYYSARNITIVLECSEGDDRFRSGEIAHINKMIGKNLFIHCNWEEELDFASLFTEESAINGRAVIDQIYWKGKLLSVEVNFKTKEHCRITMNFACDPYKQCRVYMHYLNGTAYQQNSFGTFKIPNFNDAVTTSPVYDEERFELMIYSEEGDSSQILNGSAALEQLELVKLYRGSYVPRGASTWGNFILPLNNMVEVFYEGVTML